MIAWAGCERLGQNDPLDYKARPRWPLDPEAAPARSVELRTRSEEREDDPFDLPPE